MKLQDLLKDAYKDGMSVEDITKALEGIEMPNNNELEKLKAAVSKANSEAADYKKKLKDAETAKMSEEEKKSQELAELKEQLDTLRKEKAIADNKAEFIALGYDDQMAAESASALLANDFQTVFKNQKAFLEGYSKKIEGDLLKGTKRPGASLGTGTITPEQFDKMNYTERVKLKAENPTLFAELNK